MNHFEYRDGVLCAEDMPLTEIAAAVGTPFYCYASATLARHYRVFREAVPSGALIAYSMKANANLAVVRTLAKLGAGADVVSGGELAKALAAGVPPSRIVFSGVGKTEEEMHAGLAAGIHQFNVEGEPELDALNRVAGATGCKADIAIRVNPDVDADTHAKIATGKSENKFGVPIDRVEALAAHAKTLKHVRLLGVAVHIGSQMTALRPLEAAIVKVLEVIARLRAAGHAITRADLGGGLGVPYRMGEAAPPDPAAYGAMVAALTRGRGLDLIFEPGRLIAGNAGILVARVIYAKPGASKSFLVLDAGMNDLIRPALYDAHHDIVPVRAPAPGTPKIRYDVVGPICETGDLFAAGRDLPQAQAGDLMALLTAGAYGAVMASAYNARPPAPEVLVNGKVWAVVRPRLSYQALIAQDRIPDWLDDGHGT